jgi:hypothetical protein
MLHDAATLVGAVVVHTCHGTLILSKLCRLQIDV